MIRWYAPDKDVAMRRFKLMAIDTFGSGYTQHNVVF